MSVLPTPPKPKGVGHPKAPTSLVIKVGRNETIDLRGRVARAAYLLLINPDRARTAEQIGMSFVPPPPSRKSASEAAHKAMHELRKLVPVDFIYTLSGGRGWRVNSSARVEIIWASDEVKAPIQTAIR